MRKKLIGFLAVFACFLMLTGCGSSAGSEEAQEIPQETKSLLFSNTEMTVQQMEQVVTDGTLEDYKDFPVVYSGIQSWESAKKEVGTVDFTTDADGNGSADCFEDVSISVDEDENYIVTVKVTGDKKDANVVATYYKDLSDYVNLVTNVNYTKGELMQQAGLNTLLGMGTTFFVLILLSLIIAGFGKGQEQSRESPQKRRGVQKDQRFFRHCNTCSQTGIPCAAGRCR